MHFNTVSLRLSKSCTELVFGSLFGFNVFQLHDVVFAGSQCGNVCLLFVVVSSVFLCVPFCALFFKYALVHFYFLV